MAEWKRFKDAVVKTAERMCGRTRYGRDLTGKSGGGRKKYRQQLKRSARAEKNWSSNHPLRHNEGINKLRQR